MYVNLCTEIRMRLDMLETTAFGLYTTRIAMAPRLFMVLRLSACLGNPCVDVVGHGAFPDIEIQHLASNQDSTLCGNQWEGLMERHKPIALEGAIV